MPAPVGRTPAACTFAAMFLPATKEGNRQKAGMHYRDFVEGSDRLERIKSFIRESGQWERVGVFGDHRRYCEA